MRAIAVRRLSRCARHARWYGPNQPERRCPYGSSMTVASGINPATGAAPAQAKRGATSPQRLLEADRAYAVGNPIFIEMTNWLTAL